MPRRLPSAIIKDPNVMGGLPVVRGTRIPAHLIWHLVRQGAPLIEILEDYPSLYPEDVETAVRYAEEHPEEEE